MFVHPAVWYAYSVAFFCPLVKMFFAQKTRRKFSRIFLSPIGQEYAILNVVYQRREFWEETIIQDMQKGCGV